MTGLTATSEGARRTGRPAGARPAHVAANSFAGTRTLVRLGLRRDRVLIPVWLAVFLATAAGTAASTLDVYPTEASRRALAATINATTTMRALYGPIFDEGSAGAVVLFKVGAFGAALVAVLAIVLTVRHTRAEEEAGRLELTGAGVVGRHAPLTAAFVIVSITSVALALLTALSLVAVGLPVGGAAAFGLSWGLSGLAFAAVAGIAAQLATVARAATGLSVAVLGLSYGLRALGDTAGPGGPQWLSWLSPVGWSQQLRPFAGNRWWVAGISLAFAMLAGWCAFVLAGRRDLGAGALPDRPGPAGAGRWLAGSLGLAARLQRGTLLAWSGGFLMLGWAFGGIAANVEDALSSPAARDMVIRMGGTEALADAYLAAVMGMSGVFVSAFGVQAVLRLRGEAAAGRAEPVLATAVTRRRWAAGHALVAMLGAAWLVLLAAGTAGVSTALATGEEARLSQVLAAGAVQLPAALVTIALAIAATGLVPRAASAVAWGALVAFLLLGELGPMIGLPQWAMNLSPFAHTPRLPAADLAVAPLVGLALVGAALTVVGLEALRRRDLE